MIGARWANSAAHAQQSVRTAVTATSKVLKVGERGIYHAKVVLSEGTPEEIAAPQWEPRKPFSNVSAFTHEGLHLLHIEHGHQVFGGRHLLKKRLGGDAC